MRPPVSAAPARLAPLLFILVCGVSAAVSAQNAPHHIGTWTLSVGKSVYTPGPPPRGQVRTYSKDGDGLKAVIETVQPFGAKTTAEYIAKFDGKDYPVTGNADVDTVALNRIDEWTFDATLKRDGKVMSTARNTVSKDGRTMTITSKGTNVRGQPVSSVAVYTRK